MSHVKDLNAPGITYALFEENVKLPFYIGVTSNVRKRMNAHKNDALNGGKTHTNRKIRKILKNNKTFYMNIIVKDINLYEAFEYEKIFIKWCKDVNMPITNMTDGGDCGPVSYGDDNPSKRKSVKRKISKAKKGKKRPDIALRDHSNHSKPVNMFDMNGSFLKTFPSAKSAIRELKVKRSAIYNCLRKNKNGTLTSYSHGYKWSYV